MDFINSPVNIQALPLVQELNLNSVHASHKKILLIEWTIITIVLAAVAAVLIFTNSINSSLSLIILGAGIVFISAFYFIVIQKSFPYLAYAIRDKDVIHQKGWIVRRVKTCPLNRIQNCSVQSGPLERKYGLATLIIYTAGTNGADMRIPGLPHDEADRLRYFILQQIHAEPDETV